MAQSFRLENVGLINREKKLSFKFNGKTYYGYEGDTLASALIANGIHLVGRSFKYHRPRGFLEPGSMSLMQLFNYIETVKLNLISKLLNKNFLKGWRQQV